MAIDYDVNRDPADQLEDLYLGNRVVAFQNSLDVLTAKCMEIFEYRGLPATLPKRVLERYLIENGFAIVYRVDDDVFVSNQAPTGNPDLYGDDRNVEVQHFEDTLKLTIGIDAVLVRNDALKMGLMNLLSEFALLTAQSKITFLNLLVNARHSYVIQAKDEDAANGALEFEAQLRAGKSSVMLAEQIDIMDGVELHNVPLQGTQIQQAISLVQYIQSYYYSELGIVLNNKMTSQYQNEDELSKSTGMPLVYNMLAERLEGVRDINALFETEIEVCLSGEWSDEIENESDAATDEFDENQEGNDEVTDEVVDETPEEVANETTDESVDEVDSEEASVDDEPGDEPDEITRDELIEATETLLDEEVSDEQVSDSADDSDSDEDRTDDDEDEAERRDVESEEDDDEGR